mmetsp:Transcript_132439/g.247698  ORF Transcript_132439/g.247698 Transcript_132439/m.247698 type:complete len:221 (-) Transcript_132439:8-670(-)
MQTSRCASMLVVLCSVLVLKVQVLRQLRHTEDVSLVQLRMQLLAEKGMAKQGVKTEVGAGSQFESGKGRAESNSRNSPEPVEWDNDHLLRVRSYRVGSGEEYAEVPLAKAPVHGWAMRFSRQRQRCKITAGDAVEAPLVAEFALQQMPQAGRVVTGQALLGESVASWDAAGWDRGQQDCKFRSHGFSKFQITACDSHPGELRPEIEFWWPRTHLSASESN